MGQSYFAEAMHERPATFSLFTRHLPPGWGYLVSAGLESALDYLERFRFVEDDLAYLEKTGLFTGAFLDHLRGVRFCGDVRALPEGTLFFQDEPVLEVTGPILEAQLVETTVLNEIHFQSLVAAKAARCVDVARGRTLVDFSLRRTHGSDAGLKVARSCYLAGFDSTSNVLADQRYGIPIAGTMAHSFVECFDDEADAFRAFARSYPDRPTLLVDTYDTVAGSRRAALVADELAGSGFRLGGVRLDSGDLLELGRAVRELLDRAGQRAATIFASGSLDEREIDRLLSAGAPIDGFGVGSRLGTSADAPYLDMAYKLVAFDTEPRLKLSEGKATWPGEKQVWRLSAGEAWDHDVIGLREEEPPAGGEPLLETVMVEGNCRHDNTLAWARARAEEGRRRLGERHRRPNADAYEVRQSAALVALRDELADRLRRRHAPVALTGERLRA